YSSPGYARFRWTHGANRGQQEPSGCDRDGSSRTVRRGVYWNWSRDRPRPDLEGDAESLIARRISRTEGIGTRLGREMRERSSTELRFLFFQKACFSDDCVADGLQRLKHRVGTRFSLPL